jgi:hypothetical protein
LPADVEVWLLLTLADMADRSGEIERQREYLQAARTIAPDDLKVKAAMADWLLANEAAAAVLDLLANDEQHDALLLRLAIAAKAVRSDAAPRYARLFRERAALAAGEGLHQREMARFALEVEADPTRAVAIARANWAIQREPEDLHLLQQSAGRSGDAQASAEVAAWVAANRYEDRRLR